MRAEKGELYLPPSGNAGDCMEESMTMPMNTRRRLARLTPLLTLILLAACDDKTASAPDIRPVRTVTVQSGVSTELPTLTGEIKARYAKLFRV